MEEEGGFKIYQRNISQFVPFFYEKLLEIKDKTWLVGLLAQFGLSDLVGEVSYRRS